MEGVLVGLPLPGLIGLVSAVSIAVGFSVAKQFLNDPIKKAQEDKVLLKELLEGFELEIPSELKEVDGNVIKPIK